MPKVLNKRTDVIPADAIYVGRPSKWGNPFKIGRDGTREVCVMKYRTALLLDRELQSAAQVELRGKDLVCWCAPEACHADVLLEIANR
jgi:hypothetical protein